MTRKVAVGSAVAMVILTVALCGTVLGAQDSPLAIVTLHHRPVVHGGEIALGGIAQVLSDDAQIKDALESLPVGRAALPGESRRLSIGTLKLRMRQANIPESLIEIVSERDPVEVLTGYNTISSGDFASLIREAFEGALWVPDGAQLELAVDVTEQKVPIGDVEVRIGADNLRWGKMAIPIDLYIDGMFYKRVMVRAEARVWQEVLISQKNVTRGELIHSADVVKVKRLMPSPVQGPSLDFDLLRATRYIREGAVLTWSAVEPAPQLLKGEQVTVIAHFRTVTLVMLGEAMADGWVGEPVPIRNLESGNTFTGRLNHDGTISVDVM